MRLRLAVAIVLSLVGAHAASAAETREERAAIADLDRGAELFQKGQLEAALARFTEAQRLVPDKANPYRWMGITEARLGRCDAAVRHLDEFLRRVPASDARTVEAVTIRDRCRAELAQPRTGSVRVASDPPGAEIRLDDEASAPRGQAPILVEGLAPGAHLVFARLADHAPLSRAVTVAAGETAVVQLQLAPLLATTPPVENPGPAPAHASRRGLWIGLGIGAAIVAAGAIGLGLWLGLRHEDDPFASAHMLPPILSM